MNWSPHVSPVGVFLELAEAWKRAGEYPGDSAIDAGRILGRALEALQLAIRSRRSGDDNQFHPLIELLSDTWAMTEYGLEHISGGYFIEADRLLDEEELQDFRIHMGQKNWVRDDDKRTNETGEPDFWMVSELARLFFGGQPGAINQ